MITAAELLDVALSAARPAADLVRERAAGAVAVAATKSTPTDVVTQADRDSETLIRSLIAEQRPQDAILGEEGDDIVGTTGVRWVVDPIDGTVNFLYGIPRYAVSIAAQVDGRVVAGVVVDVARDVEYTAYVDVSGEVLSRRGGRPVEVRPATEVSQRLVATGFSYDAGLRRLQAEALVRMLPRIRDVRRIGSAALDICSVAEGTVDAYVEEGLHEWDHAAACLIAEGAGARWEIATGVGGRPLVICAPDHGFDTFRALVDDCGYLT